MKPLATVCALLALVLAGCGGSDSSTDTSESKPAPATTSAAEVQELIQAFRDEKAQKDDNAAVRDECAEVTPEKDYREECAEPWAELNAVASSETEAIVNELKSRVGLACREALEGGNKYIPLDLKKISACSHDVGSR